MNRDKAIKQRRTDKEIIQERALETREKILAAAIDLYTQSGYHKTTVDEIAKHAGVSTGIAYRYFKNKKELLLSALSFSFASIGDIAGVSEEDFRAMKMEDILAAFERIHTEYYAFHEELEGLRHSDNDVKKLYEHFEESALRSLYDGFSEEVKNRPHSWEDLKIAIGLMENYSDFGIVYADDHSVGWVSHGTQDLFPDGGLYEAFSEYATDTKTNDGWCFGINGCTDRIYYIKRLNPNAILESATYTRELASVFIYPEQLEQMTIRLVDKDNNIIFSSDEGEIGSKLPSEIADEFKKDKHDKMISDGKDRSIISDKYIINFNECTNGWGVVSSIPTDTILRDINELKKFTLRISIVIALFFLLIGLAVISNIYRPMDGMVASLKERAEMDMLSGVLNKDTFQGAVENRLNEKGTNDISIIIMLDVDNFKQINDKLGHAHGDQVIIRTGKMIRRVYEDDAIIGRLGGDEFAIYSECSISEDNLNQDVYRKNREELLSVVTEQLDDLKKEFEKEFKEEKKSCDISISAGVYLSNKFDDVEENFKLIYEKADQALYVSKREGKNRYTIYEG